VNAYFPKSSSIDDDREGSSAVVEDDRGPWWANDPELIEIRRRTLEEFDRELAGLFAGGHRQPALGVLAGVPVCSGTTISPVRAASAGNSRPPTGSMR
jgi:hypothetical protein